MPAIRKIRIVNFRFNDGAKLIPDEIFCTENSEGKPIDTLLNLDNGGGKSVIVQLLLQPVCPKAKVQNRSISDYFQKGTDHAFVLIEWALDGSSNSLLTGIALAASTTADDENESKTVRYYTFMHDYTRTGDKLDLIDLPLSERTGSRIRALSFDDVRKFLQKKNVKYYPSDSLRRYHKDLEEYGILHTEWENLLVRINAVEGGIAKFFEEYKTADRLLDRFIIPGVMPNERGASEELEDMFVNYADSYQRVGRLYENLNTLSKKSTVQIGNVKKQMIRIELPEIDPLSKQPADRIDQYITEQVKKYLSEQETSAKSHHDHLDIRRLLNCYIGKGSIPITVFKIDKNIHNSRYRPWQDALKANSGGEQFVVLFSLVVSIMNYTRSLTNSLNHTSGVLILDNPFGPISSPHLLEPMFRIAQNFHIQLICLTHLGTAAVTSFFDMVYQLRFKSLPLSNIEILESEAKQHMEHAYYLSEQLSLF